MTVERMCDLFLESWNRSDLSGCQRMALALWEESEGIEREFCEGLIRGALGFVSLDRKDLEESGRQLGAALDLLEDLPPRLFGFPVREFVETLSVWQARARLMDAMEEIDFSREMLPVFEIPSRAPATGLR